MINIKAVIKSSRIHQIGLIVFLSLYLIVGINTQFILIAKSPPSVKLFADFEHYERALSYALNKKDPYSIRSIGQGYLYPPPALLIIETFHSIKPFFLKFLIYSAFNVAIMILIVTNIAKYYGYSSQKIWYWYVLCLGFSPFLELLYVGQINLITLLGICMLFLWSASSPIISGFGLGLAIITKVSPILFFWYLGAIRKFKSIMATLVWIVVITSVSIIKYGISPVLKYPKVLQWITEQLPISTNSQSLVSKIAMLSQTQFQQLFSIIPEFLTSEYQIGQRFLTFYILLVIFLSSLITLRLKQPIEPVFIIVSLGATLLPNVMWYHHYVFLLLPILIWMGWKQLDIRVITWCLIGFLIIQVDRFYLTGGLLIHIFSHISLLAVLLWQFQQAKSQPKGQPLDTLSVKKHPEYS